jgi:hypothetical protein
MQLIYQSVDVIQSALFRIDVAVIRYVITQIQKGRWIDRGEPEHINAEPLEVVDAADQALQVATPITSKLDTERSPAPEVKSNGRTLGKRLAVTPEACH